MLFCGALVVLAGPLAVFAASSYDVDNALSSAGLESINYVKTNYAAAAGRFREESTNTEAGWLLGRATFDRADLATNDVERASFAEQGIAACEAGVAHDPKSAPAHYYLGMNLGQLARTRELSALKIVKRMEKEFLTAQQLDEKFDYAGPDRNLGLLYREAPAVLSIGNRKDARQHLQRSIELAPQYPGNRINLIETYLKWGDHAEAVKELKGLDAIWPAAKTNFVGVAWSASLRNWEKRRDKAAQAVGEKSPKSAQ